MVDVINIFHVIPDARVTLSLPRLLTLIGDTSGPCKVDEKAGSGFPGESGKNRSSAARMVNIARVYKGSLDGEAHGAIRNC